MSRAAELTKELETLTVDIVHRIDELTYEELAAFSDARELLVEQLAVIRTDLTESDKQILRSLRQFDNSILSKMKFYKDEAGEWILRQGEIRGQQSAYKATYTADSMFFDYKK